MERDSLGASRNLGMRGALVHDASYQLMRMELLDKKRGRESDIILKQIWKEDKVLKPVRWFFYKVLRKAGGSAASPSNKKPILTAPKLCIVNSH